MMICFGAGWRLVWLKKLMTSSNGWL
jgi:hypothetical protein